MVRLVSTSNILPFDSFCPLLPSVCVEFYIFMQTRFLNVGKMDSNTAVSNANSLPPALIDFEEEIRTQFKFDQKK